MKYTALTIGPIVKSLYLAHRTKELWAASYFFSFLMQSIIQEVKDKNAIILPYPDKLEPDIKVAGLFPDRLILQSEDGKFKELQNAVNNAINTCGEKFGVSSRIEELKNYISAHIVEFTYREREEKINKDSGKNEDNFIFQANDFLANCELQANYSALDSGIFLKMLQNIDNTPVYKEVFGEDKNFPSILEIATRSLDLPSGFLKGLNKLEDSEIWDKIIELGKEEKITVDTLKKEEQKEEAIKKYKIYGKLKQTNKYIAIVQADGDNVSEIIKKVVKDKDKGRILEFSKALSRFSIEAVKKINAYGGVPVYIGGDDLLFFAPVANSGLHMFKLIEELDKEFKSNFADNFKVENTTPSMSYGVSITYYKYPMHEALRTARELLYDRAKKEPAKNSIAFRVLLHSGQFFEAILNKPINPAVKSMLNQDNGLAINSVIYNLERHKIILKQIIDKKENLDNFFLNIYDSFDFDKKTDLLDNVKASLYDTFQKTSDFEKTINSTYAQLRIVKFLNTKYNE